ncbi:hypothetical protein CL634_01445 [bacterium]|nr:hypothetical protein [bacterium]|tara:strand:- start:202 stop:1206 length:1005 start_codon:yes stop_codon:yes gene_type:complete
MAFLDNSGDIILDAVLTDTGRFRLARGDGTFKIAKFALGDDEINYGLYRNANHEDGAHSSGSAYYDLEILQTPVLEAFTNNTSMLKSRLISISRTNLLYLPKLKLNEVRKMAAMNADGNQAAGFFVVAVDEDTEEAITTNVNAEDYKGVIFGTIRDPNSSRIYIDQGLDTTEISPAAILDGDLVETQYVVEIDNRLGRIRSSRVAGLVPAAATLAVPSFIDDDNIASYYFSEATDSPTFIRRNLARDPVGEAPSGLFEVISGPRGTSLTFEIASSLDLQQSTFLFGRLGETGKTWTRSVPPHVTHSQIDTNIRVTGLTTGFRLDIPVRFIKKDA